MQVTATEPYPHFSSSSATCTSDLVLNPSFCRACPTLNINLEMNYWHAETCNLAECHLPLFDFLEQLAVTGATTAKVTFVVSILPCLSCLIEPLFICFQFMFYRPHMQLFCR